MTRILSPLLALSLVVASPVSTQADSPVAEARSFLAKNQPREAVDLLEVALPEVGLNALPEVLATLRDAYTQAIAKATTEGNTKDADRFREGLSLLPKAQPKPAEPPVQPIPEVEPEPPSDLPDVAPKSSPPQALPEPRALPEPAAPAKPPEDDSAKTLAQGDRAWNEKRYADAGAAYAELARAEKLPRSRHDHWAYCRLVSVLERINAQPKSPVEWSEIHAEIDHIRLLSPKNWYSEYLRNVVVERSGGVRPAAPQKLVLRGGSPDDGEPAKRPSQAPATRKPVVRAQNVSVPSPLLAAASSDPAPAAAPRPRNVEIGRAGAPMGNWKRYVTANFQIFHNDEALARQVAARAEATREAAIRLWTGAEPKARWTPLCDVYLYPTAAIFAEQTQQPAESPGFSTAGLSGGRVTARLVKLRADAPKMVEAVLPHEVTHIVLADLFPTRQIPRWADEGMAVLSEPETEQALRARDLAEPLKTDVLFALDVLMTADYPGGEYWALYYAQSVSVTRYLVNLGTAPQFAAFVKRSQTDGLDVALEQTYGIKGTADLEARWKAHAQESLAPAALASEPAGDGTATRR